MDHISAWQAWLVAALGLGLVELVNLDLVLLMLASGAVVGMVTALLDGALWLQVLLAVTTAAAARTVLRPEMVRRLHAGPTLATGPSQLVGRTGVVVEAVSAGAGLVRIGGDYWSARPYDDQDVIEAGAVVDVFEIKGATALVHPVPRLDQA
jgi:membrane protein implicated in regulation of membrane protease activity